jgi:hypothetical protein
MNYNAYYGVADIIDTSLTGSMNSSDVPLVLPLTRPITTVFSSSMGYTTATLLQYSQTAASRMKMLPPYRTSPFPARSQWQPVRVMAVPT